jgi:hypothetical protein
VEIRAVRLNWWFHLPYSKFVSFGPSPSMKKKTGESTTMDRETEKPFDRRLLEGMTTNERLFETKQLDRFDEARAAGDTDTVRRILRSVYLDEPSIQMIIRDIEHSRKS